MLIGGQRLHSGFWFVLLPHSKKVPIQMLFNRVGFLHVLLLSPTASSVTHRLLEIRVSVTMQDCLALGGL